MDDKRPNPEKLLEQIQAEERQEHLGKLKIYLGAAPGVGKTYTMLQDALNKKKQGLDIVIGVVETHGRKEVESLTTHFEKIPLQNIDYHGKPLREFNLDAALQRKPNLILVDEMAHTNVPGLRHNKRWQDIKEILDRGIDVYTTLNVQHIESLNDIVSQIIGIHVRETVPDSLLELANTIEVIDLPPEDLLKRLQEGKVYVPEQIAQASQHFFRIGNLIALRELALRVTAEQVGTQVLLYRQGRGIEQVWPTTERILVCVNSDPESTKLIRTARRFARFMHADWVAIYVETPALRMLEEKRNSAIENLRLAELLGAKTKIQTGLDIPKEIMGYARDENITKIIIGKKMRPLWKDFLFGNIVDKLIRQSGEIGIYVISSNTPSATFPKKTVTNKKISWPIYVFALGMCALITCINFLIYPNSESSNLIMIYLLGVILVALFGRFGPSILASILSVMAYDFFFVPPRFSLLVSDIQYFFTLTGMMLVAFIISYLTILLRNQTQTAKLAEQRSSILHTLSRRLARTRGIANLLAVAISYISDVFEGKALILLPENGQLRGKGETELLNDKEQSLAHWVYDMGQVAGLGTNTLPFSEALYLPLLASQGTVGVLRFQPLQKEHLLDPEQMTLLEACANQIALALEVDRLQEQQKKAELEIETDRLRSTLLQSISHDLHSPLVSIMAYASALVEMNNFGNDSALITQLGKDIYLESEQLNRLINNLMQMTHLEAENVKLDNKPHSLKNTIDESLQILTPQLKNQSIEIRLPEHLPEIPFDKDLIKAVFINLIDNAIKFAPSNTPIVITALLKKNQILISVEDTGPGINPDEINKLFEKFYRGRDLVSEKGIGLGLAICHWIIKAHGGDIWAENRKEGGAAFRFTLPLK